MLNTAYKIGASRAASEALRSEDPQQIQALVTQLTSIEDPKLVSKTHVNARNGTDVTKSVSWGSKMDLSNPVG